MKTIILFHYNKCYNSNSIPLGVNLEFMKAALTRKEQVGIPKTFCEHQVFFCRPYLKFEVDFPSNSTNNTTYAAWWDLIVFRKYIVVRLNTCTIVLTIKSNHI